MFVSISMVSFYVFELQFEFKPREEIGPQNGRWQSGSIIGAKTYAVTPESSSVLKSWSGQKMSL